MAMEVEDWYVIGSANRHKRRRWYKRFKTPPASWRRFGPITLEQHEYLANFGCGLNPIFKEMYGGKIETLVYADSPLLRLVPKYTSPKTLGWLP